MAMTIYLNQWGIAGSTLTQCYRSLFKTTITNSCGTTFMDIDDDWEDMKYNAYHEMIEAYSTHCKHVKHGDAWYDLEGNTGFTNMSTAWATDASTITNTMYLTLWDHKVRAMQLLMQYAAEEHERHMCKIYKEPPVPAHQRLEEIIAARRMPYIIVKNPNRNPLPQTTDIREIRARQTLRRLVGEEQYRNFLRHSLVSIQGKSGRSYAVRPGHTNVHVWDKGKQVGSLCIQLSGNFPPTDSVVMRCLMIWNQEDEFWNRANKHGVPPAPVIFQIKPNDERPLTQILADLRTQTSEKSIAGQVLKQREERFKKAAKLEAAKSDRRLRMTESDRRLRMTDEAQREMEEKIMRAIAEQPMRNFYGTGVA